MYLQVQQESGSSSNRLSEKRRQTSYTNCTFLISKINRCKKKWTVCFPVRAHCPSFSVELRLPWENLRLTHTSWLCHENSDNSLATFQLDSLGHKEWSGMSTKKPWVPQWGRNYQETGQCDQELLGRHLVTTRKELTIKTSEKKARGPDFLSKWLSPGIQTSRNLSSYESQYSPPSGLSRWQ